MIGIGWRPIESSGGPANSSPTMRPPTSGTPSSCRPIGRLDESLATIRRAQQLDPTSLTINVIAGQTYFFARRFDEAIEETRKTLEMDPDFFLGHDYLGWAYRQKGMHEEALAEFKKAQQVEDTPLTDCMNRNCLCGCRQ